MEHLFKAYDIRGRYPEEISEDFAYKLGRALATHLAGKEIIIGRDCRIGSDKLSEALIKGIIDQGNTAINIGLCSMPMFVFATQQGPGVLVTSPHHGKEYNGFTICQQGGQPLTHATGLDDLRQLIVQNKFEKKKKGNIKRRNVINSYVSHVRQFKGKLKKLKVVFDAGNGVAGLIVPKVFGRLVSIIPLFFEPDGNFPNRDPRPTKENLAALCKAVKQHKANLGIAYDSDCDRIAFVDERGIVAQPDHILALLAQQMLKQQPHAKVLHDVRCSRIVKEHVTKLGGLPVITRVGTTFMNDIMKDEEAIVGGELSAHYYFRDNFCADNGDIAALLIISLISEERKPLSKLLEPLKKYFTVYELQFPVKDNVHALKKVEQKYSNKGKAYHVDGLSVEFPDWWFNLRPNTDGMLRLTVEAKTKALLDRKLAELKRKIM